MKISILNQIRQSHDKFIPLSFLKVLSLVLPVMGLSLFADNRASGSPTPPARLLTSMEQASGKLTKEIPPSSSMRKSLKQGLGKDKTSSKGFTQTTKVSQPNQVMATKGFQGTPGTIGEIKRFPTASVVVSQTFPLGEGEVFGFSPLPPLLPPAQPKEKQQLPFSIPSIQKSTNVANLKSGLFQAEPYSMLVLVPPTGVDDEMVISPDAGRATEPPNQMPIVKPELRLRPLQKESPQR